MSKINKTKEQPESVTYSKSFAGVIRQGPTNKELIMNSQVWYQHELNKFRDGEKCTLIIHTRRAKRSEQQNRYYWGVYLPTIAEETGERNLDRLHELFKGKFLTEGIVEVLGSKVRMKKSTTALNVADFCAYIMDIEIYTEIQAPPTENYDLAPLPYSQSYPQAGALL